MDELPDSLQFVSASAGCQFLNANNSVGCFVPNFGGGTAAITIVVTPTECGTFTNTAFIPTIDEESDTFRVVGCEQPQAKQPPPQQPRVEQQPAGAAPVTQESEQESEAGEIDQSFEVS